MPGEEGALSLNYKGIFAAPKKSASVPHLLPTEADQKERHRGLFGKHNPAALYAR